jgi:hypothetical protein
MSTTTPLEAGPSTLARAALALVTAVVAASVVDTVIAALAHAAGASHGFRPLQFATYTSLTVIGILLADLAWLTVRARSADPGRLLRSLVPVVVGLSFIPDVLVGATKSQAHTSWGAVGALMLMHLVVAASAVASFRWLLPLGPRRGRAGMLSSVENS